LHTQFRAGIFNGKHLLGNTNIDGSIIIKRILDKYVSRDWSDWN
jgi:hypothetical protein